MEPVSRKYRGDLAFAQRRKLNHVTQIKRDLSPNREQPGGGQTRQAVDPRWDPFSGEITSSEKGKAQSVKPKNFGVSLRSENETKLRTMNLTTPTPLGERIRKLNSQASFESLEVKSQDYSAYSPSSNYRFETQSPDLPPVPKKDNASPSVPKKDTASPSVPKKDIASPSGPKKDIASPLVPRKDTASPSVPQKDTVLLLSQKPASILPKIPTGTEQNDKVTEIKTKIVATIDPARKNKNVIYGDDNSNDDLLRVEKMSLEPPEPSPKQPLLVQRLESPQLSAKKDQSSPSSIIEPSFRKSPAYSPPQHSSGDTDKNVKTPRLVNSNTNALKDSSPLSRVSDDTQNDPPIKISARTQDESAVMNRVRPKVMASHFNRINRKAVPLNSPIFISMSNNSVINAKEWLRNSKALPQAPAENPSHDLVTALQAHLDSLANRRRKISQSIRQMTELMPRENLLITEEVRLRREREKRHVAMLLEEEAEIKREEHEVGLRLHRAWKRTESGAVYEPTSLWVRRVTCGKKLDLAKSISPAF
ncbi:hypothetical protein GcM3_014017 [Golovinomyces cichoracearum]|uniref:Uncharacterized protein n=1 Tax=Golovinomyces cichoracearum TaxID=62708 RepID=A0A420J986_9PEZI|nr:hypothetical protein GcM3_014017 [Golovinomyces cichoracearum]